MGCECFSYPNDKLPLRAILWGKHLSSRRASKWQYLTMNLLVLLIILMLLFGGGGLYLGGPLIGGGGFGLILLILLVLYFTGNLKRS